MGPGGGVRVNKTLVVCCVITVALVLYLVSSYRGRKIKQQSMHAQWHEGRTMEKIPEEVKNRAKQIKLEHNEVTVKSDGYDVKVFYREARPVGSPKMNVLFLHGMKFSSKEWEDLKSLNLVAAMGYRALAVDLPGYGKSTNAKVDPLQFMKTLIQELDADRPVIISPSMSGRFSLPFLMQEPTKAHEYLKGFIPIAPVNTEKYEHHNYHKVEVPTMILYGEKDTTLGLISLSNLRTIKNSNFYQIPLAGHACYLDEPELFHYYIYNFLSTLEKGQE